MTGSTSEATLAAAERVARILADHGIDCAIIGGLALSFHGYIRATLDLDLATSIDPFDAFPGIVTALRAEGFQTDFREPDGEDPLGGVLDIRRADIDLIQIVNFMNPLGGGHAVLGKEAVETAQPAAGTFLKVVDLPHLILLKLYSGGLGSLETWSSCSSDIPTSTSMWWRC